VLGGPGYLLVAQLAGWQISDLTALVAIVAFVAGFATLVVRMSDRPATTTMTARRLTPAGQGAAAALLLLARSDAPISGVGAELGDPDLGERAVGAAGSGRCGTRARPGR